MKTILLITARYDPAADLLLAELRRRNVPVVRWNTYEFPLESTLTYDVSDDGFSAVIVSDGRAVDFSTVGSIWWQWDQPGGFPDTLEPAERRFAERQAHLALEALLVAGEAVWINHPSNERLAYSKPAQLFRARQAGLEIPRTIVSNDPDRVRRFVGEAQTQTVHKALSPPRMIDGNKVLFTSVLTDDAIANLDLIRITPAIFQERVEKDYELRVTVVGERIFSARIDSQANPRTALDWRRAQHEVGYEAVELPGELQTKIRRFMASLGLVYGALDFVVTPEGRYVFLEVNPSGAYMWVECATGLDITGALADLLIAPCRT